MFRFEVGDRVEDSEGDAGEVVATRMLADGHQEIRVRWDCTGKKTIFVPASRFGLVERPALLTINRMIEETLRQARLFSKPLSGGAKQAQFDGEVLGTFLRYVILCEVRARLTGETLDSEQIRRSFEAGSALYADERAFQERVAALRRSSVMKAVSHD